MTIEFIWLIVSWFIASFIGAVGGAFAYGLAVGRWKAKVEAALEAAKDDRQHIEQDAAKSRKKIHEDIEEIEQRLEKGDDWLAEVPALKAELHNVATEMTLLRKQLQKLVTRRECDLRHGVACDARD